AIQKTSKLDPGRPCQSPARRPQVLPPGGRPASEFPPDRAFVAEIRVSSHRAPVAPGSGYVSATPRRAGRMKRTTLTLLSCVLIAAAAATAWAGPAFDADGKLVIPEGRDRWVTLGTTYALSYEGDGGTTLNTVRMDPESYDVFVKTGKYPVGAML